MKTISILDNQVTSKTNRVAMRLQKPARGSVSMPNLTYGRNKVKLNRGRSEIRSVSIERVSRSPSGSTYSERDLQFSIENDEENETFANLNSIVRAGTDSDIVDDPGRSRSDITQIGDLSLDYYICCYVEDLVCRILHANTQKIEQEAGSLKSLPHDVDSSTGGSLAKQCSRSEEELDSKEIKKDIDEFDSCFKSQTAVQAQQPLEYSTEEEPDYISRKVEYDTELIEVRSCYVSPGDEERPKRSRWWRRLFCFSC